MKCSNCGEYISVYDEKEIDLVTGEIICLDCKKKREKMIAEITEYATFEQLQEFIKTL